MIMKNAPSPLIVGTLLATLLTLASSAPAAADPHPDTAGGVAVDQVFQAGNVDNINLFNGALTVTIPLGINYPINNTFSYQFLLVANSNPWDFWVQGAIPPLPDSIAESQPTHCSNAGLGWRVSFGAVQFGKVSTPGSAVCAITSEISLKDPALAVYEAADGSQHLFYATLHPGDPDDSFNGIQDSLAGNIENVLYTRDGSYLRLRRLGGNVSEIDFPDGKVHAFNASGMITSITDPFGKAVTFSYLSGSSCTNALAGETSCWKIGDSEARTHWVYFRSDLKPYNNVPPYGALISRIVLAAFGGAQATYQFNYTVPAAFGRGCPMHDLTMGDVTAPILTSVTLPDGSSYAPGTSGYLLQPAGKGNCVSGSASLTHLTLPTLGSIGWTYQIYTFPVQVSPYGSRQSSPGVASRTTYDPFGSAVGQWSYQTVAAGNPAPPYLTNTVTDPLGNRSVRYFSTAFNVAFGPGPNIYDYGKPYNPSTTMPGNPSLYLSQQTFDASGTLRRTEYARFEHDLVNNPSGAIADASNCNGREAQHETVYDDGLQSGSTASLFDGLGHYRQTATDGTFPGNDVRTAYHAFNPSQGTYTVNQSANTLSTSWFGIAASSPWILGNSTYQYATENGVSELKSFCYDANTGFLLRQRTYTASATDPSTMSSNDVIEVFAEGGGGNSTAESFYGGDLAAVAPSSSNLCSQTLPATPEYQLNHSYVSGVLRTTQYSGASFFNTSLGIDASTGLPNYSDDTAGIRTSFTYDSMGRLTYNLPRDGAWTQYLYHAATSPSSLASLTVEKQQNGAPSSVLAETIHSYDGFGRPVQKSMLMGNGAFSSQTTSYNALDWKVAVSALGTPNQNVTQYMNYDAFGRVGLIRPPDSTSANGFAHDITYSYSGIQSSTKTTHVGTSWTGTAVAETPTSRVETHDRFGRLASITEPSGASGRPVTTSYQYDAGNRLAIASTTSAGTIQTRVFSYDHRGDLDWVTEPETSADSLSNGHHKDFLNHDSRGHVHRTVDGSNDLSYTYDFAERPLLIYKTANGSNCAPTPATLATCVKKWTYDNVAAGALGRVFQATRYNHLLFAGSPNTAAWTYTYTYGVPDGQIVQRTLQDTFNGQAGSTQEAFSQSWAYDQLHNISSESYPTCASSFSACAGVAGRTVQNSYTYGYLTSIPGYTAGSGVTYYSNGMVASVTHANGLTTTYGLDPFHLPRPASIAAGSLWSSGSYAYDGDGNVTQIGHGYYTYDSASRLVNAQVQVNQIDAPSGDAFGSQAITYDAFGNILTLTTNGVIANTPVAPGSNHLTNSTYDSSGNMSSWNGDGQFTAAATYSYDELNQLNAYTNGSQPWFFTYDANDQRIWSVMPPAGAAPRFDRYTLRDLDFKVKRTFEVSGYAWSNQWTGANDWEDYVYRGGLLLSGIYNSGKQNNFDLDHLGSPRLTTGVGGAQTSFHVYFPYGIEATGFGTDTERMKFAGDERDLGDPSSPADDLDYLHARFFNPLTGRFLSTDTGRGSWKYPQSLNRYAYGRGNPMRFVDPTGEGAWDVVAGIGQGLWNFGADTAAGVKTMVSDPKGAAIGMVNQFETAGRAYFTSAGRSDMAASYQSLSTQEKTAVLTQALTTGAMVALGPKVAGTAFDAILDARPVTVVHYTDAAGMASISSSSSIWAESFVTLPSQIPAGAAPSLIESLLEITTGRGDFSITFTTTRGNLVVSSEGQFTSGGTLQFNLVNEVAVDPSTFVTTPDPPPAPPL